MFLIKGARQAASHLFMLFGQKHHPKGATPLRYCHLRTFEGLEDTMTITGELQGTVSQETILRPVVKEWVVDKTHYIKTRFNFYSCPVGNVEFVQGEDDDAVH